MPKAQPKAAPMPPKPPMKDDNKKRKANVPQPACSMPKMPMGPAKPQFNPQPTKYPAGSATQTPESKP